MGGPFGNGQPRIQGGSKKSRGNLANSAPVSENGPAFHYHIGLLKAGQPGHIAQDFIERKRFSRGDEYALVARGGKGNIVDPVGDRAPEAGDPSSDKLFDSQIINVTGGYF